MNNLILVRPSKLLEKEIWEYRQEYFDFGEMKVNGSGGLGYYDNFDEWLDIVLSIEKHKPRNNIETSIFFSLNKGDNKIIGSIKLHHSLTPDLENHGGHIAYGIRPSERRKGYGKQQLLLILGVAQNIKIPRVMIACDKDNIASAKTALSCGGILTREHMYEGKEQQHYWIDLN